MERVPVSKAVIARFALGLSILGGVVLAAPPAHADDDASHAEAGKHFAKARELYGQGSYREARNELVEARKLDPQSKELMFNLGIVSEKLALFDEALEQFRAYREMSDVTEQEKARADAIILRLEGAKKQLAEQKRNDEPPKIVVVPEQPKQPEGPPPKGRIDAATVTAAGVGVAGLAVGAIFGIKAMGERPSGFVTGRDGTYADLVSKTDSAHTSAVVSDVGFAVGIVGVAAAAVLYFARPKVQPKAATVAIAPAIGQGSGGLVIVGGFQ